MILRPGSWTVRTITELLSPSSYRIIPTHTDSNPSTRHPTMTSFFAHLCLYQQTVYQIDYPRSLPPSPRGAPFPHVMSYSSCLSDRTIERAVAFLDHTTVHLRSLLDLSCAFRSRARA